MDHAKSELFYRCYSTTSAGQLRSVRYHDGNSPLSGADVLYEFDNHRTRESFCHKSSPWSCVPHSKEILLIRRTPRNSPDRHYSSAELWKQRRPSSCLGAWELAPQWHHENADVYKYEYLFKWKPPRNYVEDHVSVKTLLKREIGWLLGLQRCAKGFPTFRDMQNMLVDNILEPDPYSTGRWLGSLAQAFGSRTCTYELTFQILRECLSGGHVDEANQFVRLCVSKLCGIHEFCDICDIELGIHDSRSTWFVPGYLYSIGPQKTITSFIITQLYTVTAG